MDAWWIFSPQEIIIFRYMALQFQITWHGKRIPSSTHGILDVYMFPLFALICWVISHVMASIKSNSYYGWAALATLRLVSGPVVFTGGWAHGASYSVECFHVAAHESSTEAWTSWGYMLVNYPATCQKGRLLWLVCRKGCNQCQMVFVLLPGEVVDGPWLV